jgi:hypothetical protein
MAKALRFGQIELISLQQLSASLEFFFGSLAILDIDTRSMPLENSSITGAQREFMVQHPAIFAISPPHSCGSLEALSRSERLSPLLNKALDIFRMNPGSPFPSQQALQRLPNEIQPGPIEEIEVTVRSCGVDQRRCRVDNLTKIQVSIVDGTMLGRSHGADCTTQRESTIKAQARLHRSRDRAELPP